MHFFFPLSLFFISLFNNVGKYHYTNNIFLIELIMIYFSFLEWAIQSINADYFEIIKYLFLFLLLFYSNIFSEMKFWLKRNKSKKVSFQFYYKNLVIIFINIYILLIFVVIIFNKCKFYFIIYICIYGIYRTQLKKKGFTYNYYFYYFHFKFNLYPKCFITFFSFGKYTFSVLFIFTTTKQYF